MMHSFLSYNKWANSLIISYLNEMERNEKMEYLFSHILNTHRIWNARLKGEQFGGLPFDTIGRSMWENIDIQNHENSLYILNNMDPDSIITYEDTKENEYKTSIKDTILHVINHSTHHRGQIVSMIRQLDMAPPITDYVAWDRLDKPDLI
ncbi:MAG: DinB family protein [Bacteroidia bacterium]